MSHSVAGLPPDTTTSPTMSHSVAGLPPDTDLSRDEHDDLVQEIQSILSRKRKLPGSRAHDFDNIKVPKRDKTDRPAPLKLSSPPPPRVREDRAVRKHRLRKEGEAQITARSATRRSRPEVLPTGPPVPAPLQHETSTMTTHGQAPGHLPFEIIQIIQHLYYDKHRITITPEQAVLVWSHLKPSQKGHVWQLYDHVIAEANLRVEQAQATSLQEQPQEFPPALPDPLASEPEVVHDYPMDLNVSTSATPGGQAPGQVNAIPGPLPPPSQPHVVYENAPAASSPQITGQANTVPGSLPPSQPRATYEITPAPPSSQRRAARNNASAPSGRQVPAGTNNVPGFLPPPPRPRAVYENAPTPPSSQPRAAHENTSAPLGRQVPAGANAVPGPPPVSSQPRAAYHNPSVASGRQDSDRSDAVPGPLPSSSQPQAVRKDASAPSGRQVPGGANTVPRPLPPPSYPRPAYENNPAPPSSRPRVAYEHSPAASGRKVPAGANAVPGPLPPPSQLRPVYENTPAPPVTQPRAAYENTSTPSGHQVQAGAYAIPALPPSSQARSVYAGDFDCNSEPSAPKRVPPDSSAHMTRAWSLSTTSSGDEFGLGILESTWQPSMDVDDRRDVQPPTQRTHPFSSHMSSDEGTSRSTSRSSSRSTVASVKMKRAGKGKQRAMDSSGSVDSLGHQGWEPASHSRRGSSSGPHDPGDQSGQMNSQLAFLLLQHMQNMQASVREQADALRETVESNKLFQAKMAIELELLKTSLGANSRAAAPESPPSSIVKTTRTRASDMRVDRRISKAMGRLMPPTVEEEERRVRNLLIDRVHKHVLALLGCNDTSTLAERFPPLSEDDVASYRNGDGKIVCSPVNFRIDFHNPWKAFDFNIEARVVLINTFLAKTRSGAFASDPIPDHLLTAEVIGSALDRYMISLRRAYRAQVKPPSKENTDKAKRVAAITARQGTLYRSRRFIIGYVNTLKRHRAFFNRLSANNMSGDETDGDKVTHAPVYRIILAEWQSDALRAFLWAVDAEYIRYWESPPDSRRSKGNVPRKRVLRNGGRTISGTAPTGLWRNCYNPSWLAKKKEWEVEALQIINEDYDFTLPMD